MRIWDIPPSLLCKQHLLGEHRELHGLWNILTKGKKGYRNHPETKRWVGKTFPLYIRHTLLVVEMQRRGFKHNSLLDDSLAKGPAFQDVQLISIEEQFQILKSKPCECLREVKDECSGD